MNITFLLFLFSCIVVIYCVTIYVVRSQKKDFLCFSLVIFATHIIASLFYFYCKSFYSSIVLGTTSVLVSAITPIFLTSVLHKIDIAKFILDKVEDKNQALEHLRKQNSSLRRIIKEKEAVED